MDNIHENLKQIEIPVVKKLYDLYLLTHKLISKFPKHEKYTLGERIENNIIESIELIVFGNAQPKNFKDGYLFKANAKIEILKIFYRIAFEINAVEMKNYLKTEEILQEIGKMLGGWIKYLKSN